MKKNIPKLIEVATMLALIYVVFSAQHELRSSQGELKSMFGEAALDLKLERGARYLASHAWTLTTDTRGGGPKDQQWAPRLVCQIGTSNGSSHSYQVAFVEPNEAAFPKIAAAGFRHGDLVGFRYVGHIGKEPPTDMFDLVEVVPRGSLSYVDGYSYDYVDVDPNFVGPPAPPVSR